MADSGTLSRKKAALVAALPRAPSVREAAERAGCSERSAWRWLGEAEVRQELSKRQDALLSAVTCGLVADLELARSVLCSLALSPEQCAKRGASVRLGAARALLDSGLRFAELVVLSERVAILEERIARQ